MERRLISCVVIVLLAAVVCDAYSFNRLEEYDVVWDSPGAGSSDSMPLGNGDIGLNVWTEADGDLVFYISKTDSWGDNSRLLKVGKVRVEMSPAALKVGEGFEQRLILKEGTVFVRYGEGPALKVWVDANNPVIHVALESDRPVALRASVELWRNERYELPSIEVSDIYLHRSKPGGKYAATIVEPDTVLKNQRGRIGWYHHNSKSVGPELTMKVQGLDGFEMLDPILHRTFGAIITGEGAERIDDVTLSTKAGRSGRLDVYVLTAHPAKPDEWLGGMEDVIEGVGEIGFEKRLAAHKKWWADFWDRSWIYAEQNARRKASVIKPSDHPVRIGVDQTGQNRLGGLVGRVSIFGRALEDKVVSSVSKIDRDKPVGVKDGLLYSSSRVTVGAIAGSKGWDFDDGVTLEAWVKPEKMGGGGGRIVDKITPGGDDGFLFDTYPGNSLRFITEAGTIGKKDVLAAGEWSHVAAAAGADGLSLYLNGKRIAHQAVEAGSDAFVVTRGYILQRFINACAGRGAYPIKFNGSIFTVDNPGSPGYADYRRWGPGYWWQNTRLPYISMCASGDYDLMGPLFEMYAGQVFELSKYRTRHYFGHEGAYYPECIYFWGTVFSESYGWQPAEEREDKLQTSGWHKWEWVSGLEFVWMMLDYYDHTQDEEFLAEKVLPVGREVVAFFDNYYDTGADGKLVMHPSQAVETWWKCTNPMPEVAGLHAVTQRLLSLPERLTSKEQRAYYKGIAGRLPGVPTWKVGDVEMLAPAEKFENKRNIENPELYAVFPFRLVAIGKGDIELGIEALKHRWDKGNFGWRQEEIFMAYLGLAEEARENLVGRAKRSHRGSRFPAFWGPNYDWVPDQDHGGILLKAFQSMAMQTDGRKIFVLPAWPKEWNIDFKLRAPYNTAVYGVVRDGELKSLKVTPAERRQDVVVMEPQ